LLHRQQQLLGLHVTATDRQQVDTWRVPWEAGRRVGRAVVTGVMWRSGRVVLFTLRHGVSCTEPEAEDNNKYICKQHEIVHTAAWGTLDGARFQRSSWVADYNCKSMSGGFRTEYLPNTR
jgi:hypothetical protein